MKFLFYEGFEDNFRDFTCDDTMEIVKTRYFRCEGFSNLIEDRQIIVCKVLCVLLKDYNDEYHFEIGVYGGFRYYSRDIGHMSDIVLNFLEVLLDIDHKEYGQCRFDYWDGHMGTDFGMMVSTLEVFPEEQPELWDKIEKIFGRGC